MSLNDREFPKFLDWVGQKLHDLLHGSASGQNDRAAPRPALIPVAAPAPSPRPKGEGERHTVGAKLFSYGQQGYGGPQGYGPPPKSGGGSSVAIIIGVILVVVLGGGLVVCGGIGFFFVRAGKEFEAQAQQAMQEADRQIAIAPPVASSPSGEASAQPSPFSGPPTGMPRLDLGSSPSGFPSDEGLPDVPGGVPAGVSPIGPTSEPLGEIVTDEAMVSVGDKLLAEWGGQWWKAEVLETRADGQVKIHYEGWGDTWDDWYPRAKLRMRGN